MNVASLELCKELYELSGWENKRVLGPYPIWWRPTEEDEWLLHLIGSPAVYLSGDMMNAAYDLGYLLRKLPGKVHQNKMNYEPYLFWDDESKWWGAQYRDMSDAKWTEIADTPEDAACKLAIELFKQGILTREG